MSVCPLVVEKYTIQNEAVSHINPYEIHCFKLEIYMPFVQV